MHTPAFFLCGLLLVFNLQQCGTYPVRTGLTETDIDVLKMIINRLEESVSEQSELDQSIPADKDGLESLKIEEAADGQQSQTSLDEEAIREFFSAKNLKNVRNDSSKRSSSCFGRRMDRIGSMSSLGCNTVSKYNPKQR